MQNVSPPFRDYAPHKECLDLMAHGLTDQTISYWSLDKATKLAVIIHREFDPYDIYTDFFQDIAPGVASNTVNIPAYSVMDMISLLPDLIISNINTMYEVCAGNGPDSIFSCNESLPMALADLLKNMIRAGRINLEKANKHLHYSIQKQKK